MIACYCSPNVKLSSFLEFLDEMEIVIGNRDLMTEVHDSILICGDFNAKATLWGSPFTDRRGEILRDWMAQWNLCLVNTGLTPTCIRSQGTSFIDITWASPSLYRRICDWSVCEEVEPLSDHLYIFFEILEICRWPQEDRPAPPGGPGTHLTWTCSERLLNGGAPLRASQRQREMP